ncbi:unnamed protein product [Mytilus coruscus]|uniref:Uncharacterized protein n=1 Tax=Mytilus coruscus TaxID=42192 RepID=A0A6J8C2G1_MYTCO|nr:unnamed protein product [Mytilus coruscus]
MLLKPRGSYVNSLSSIVYCVIATLAQCYICYSYLGPYETTLDEKWSGTYRSGYGVRLGLPIIGLFVLPLFILFSIFRVGNYANDGFKIGRDHALTAQTNFFGDRFEKELTRRIWRNFCPFAPTLHLFIAFSLILPDTILTGLDVKYGHQNSDAVWSSDVDFLYSKDRPLLTDHVVRLNTTPASINLTIHPLYTTSNNGGYRPSAAFVYFLASLSTYAIRILDYANVGQPIFVIKSNNLTRTPSISIASIDIKDLTLPMVKPKRPGSIQSMDITPSESGFDEGETAPSTEDEKFGISLPPLREYDEHMDQNDVILRRSRNRRSGGQRVTFHENVRGSLSTDALNETQRSKSPMSEDLRMNVTADIHSGSRNKYVRRSSDPDAKRLRNNRHNCNSVPRQNGATDKQFNHELADYIANIKEITQNHRESSADDGEKCEIEVDYLSPNRNRPERRPRTPQGSTPEKVILRHSGPKNSREQTPEKILNKNLVNKCNRNSDPETTKNNIAEELANNKNFNKAKKGELISNEDKQLQKQNNDFFTRSEKPDIVPNENRGQVYPRPIKFVPRNPENIRRDSANYSQTSSQDNSSNDSSEQTTLYSQV